MTREGGAPSKEPLCWDSPLRLRWGQACPEAEEWRRAGAAGLKGAKAQQGRDNGEMTSGKEVWQVLKVVLSDGLQFLTQNESGRARSGPPEECSWRCMSIQQTASQRMGPSRVINLMSPPPESKTSYL